MLRLTLHTPPAVPVLADCLAPDRLAGLSAGAVARLPMQCGNCAGELGDWFAVSGDVADGEVLIEGNCASFKGLGAGMSRGRLGVKGSAGSCVGAGMSGGEIHVEGDAGDAAGSAMSGGLLRVAGSVGAQAGGLLTNGTRMRGGTILVGGAAGDRVGARMRRGLIAVRGGVGTLAGMDMRAGTILIFGPAANRPGVGMKRGTVTFFANQPAAPPGFRASGVDSPTFMALYLNRLKAWEFPLPKDCLVGGTYLRFVGDRSATGKGELLYWRRSPG